MAQKQSFIFLLSLAVCLMVIPIHTVDTTVSATSTDSVILSNDIENVYKQYLDEDSRKTYDKMQAELKRIEEQEQQREENDRLWNILVIVTSVIAIIPMVRLFMVYAGDKELRKSGKAMLYGATITFLGALALIIVNVGQMYFFFKLESKQQQLVFSAIILILAIALWIYVKRSRKNNTDSNLDRH